MKIIIERSKAKIFVICPVRNVSDEFREKLVCEIAALQKDYDVYYPARDTNQDDNTGYRICQDNMRAMKKAKIVFVAWDGNSTGSLFDLGMAFAMKKKIRVLSDDLFPEKSEGKSFQNMVRDWEHKREPVYPDWTM